MSLNFVTTSSYDHTVKTQRRGAALDEASLEAAWLELQSGGYPMR